jgi:RNA polymerase sigma factor (TIGR02999 family)
MGAEPESAAITILLNEDDTATQRVNRLLPLVYAQLRRAAQNLMAAERGGAGAAGGGRGTGAGGDRHTLAATALVHEAYLKLVGPRELPWQNRAHFYAAAAEAMRQVLLDHAKAKARLKRGGGRRPLHLGINDAAQLPAADHEDESDTCADFVALDDAMRRLEGRDPRMAQVVRLKYYAGLEIAQVALVLGVSERTVKNDWAFAKAWLERELGSAKDAAGHAENDER